MANLKIISLDPIGAYNYQEAGILPELRIKGKTVFPVLNTQTSLDVELKLIKSKVYNNHTMLIIKAEFGYITLRIVDGKDAHLDVGLVSSEILSMADSESDQLWVREYLEDQYLLFAFCIKDDYQKQYSGLGKNLMNIAVEVCKFIGVETFRLHCDETKHYPSGSFYSRWGITEGIQYQLGDIKTFSTAVTEKQ